MSLSKPNIFFPHVRHNLFHDRMSQDQVDGLNTLLKVWDGHDARWVADGLATAWWETDFTMEPVPEIGRGRSRSYGKPVGPQGQVYYGRGYVQLTWDYNYKRAAERISGSDVYLHPDRALDPTIAAEIMVRGMVEGWFTGRTLEKYFPLKRPERADWVGARRIINGTDHAADIAHAAVHFWEALGAGGYTP